MVAGPGLREAGLTSIGDVEGQGHIPHPGDSKVEPAASTPEAAVRRWGRNDAERCRRQLDMQAHCCCCQAHGWSAIQWPCGAAAAAEGRDVP